MSLIRKIGFWPVVSLVIGSQIGSGIFVLPATLASYGGISLFGWVVSGGAAILLALVFSELCRRYPKTGGPHAYVEAAFGRRASFFTAWCYWIISWLSSTVVVIAAVGYFGSIFGGFSLFVNLGLEIGLILLLMGINLMGVRASGYTEFVFTLLKILPLILLPLAAFFFFDSKNFVPLNLTELSGAQAVSAAALLTFWGFIGVEVATTPAESIENPRKTIPRAILLGTIVVALIYCFSSTMVMGVIPPEQLKFSQAPFVDLTKVVFGGSWHIAVALAAAIVCVGTLNAWILASGQIALGAASDNLFPAVFSKKNAHGVSVVGILVSSLGMIPLLCLTLQENLGKQLATIIDVSVTVFLCVYAICVLSYLKILKREGKRAPWGYLVGIVAFAFCLWVLWGASWRGLVAVVLIACTGVPVYLKEKNRPLA